MEVRGGGVVDFPSISEVGVPLTVVRCSDLDPQYLPPSEEKEAKKEDSNLEEFETDRQPEAANWHERVEQLARVTIELFVARSPEPPPLKKAA
jgi:hypothetical protein